MSEIVRFLILGWFLDADVTVFENGDDAWAELERRAPDLLITDSLHPGMKRDELLRRLAEQNVQYPILLLSGDLGGQANLPPKLNLACLSKPFNRDSLWLMLNELVGPCDFTVHTPEADGQFAPAKTPATEAPRPAPNN
jgi:CheY-like chemotaxis protein